MTETHPRLARERKTIEAMIRIFCRDHHGVARQLCSGCRELLTYAAQRLDKCPYGNDKPTCVNCPIHCYSPDMRQRVREVMRYSGPRMIWRHPILAAFHIAQVRKTAGIPAPKAGRGNKP